MTSTQKAVASINSLGVSDFGLWWRSFFGKTLMAETVDQYDVRYISWRGKNYTIVDKVHPTPTEPKA